MFFSLNLRTLRELSLGFGTIKASSWRCSGQLPGVSPVFDRTETILGKVSFPLARLPKLSLEALPPRELALGFGTIKASSWRCSGLIPRVSPVFDRTENYSGGNLFPTRQAPGAVSGSASPPESTLSGSVPSRHLLGAVAVYYRGSPQCSIVQKTILGEIYSPLARLPELSLGALPPREHALGFGTIKASWRCSGLLPGSPQNSIVQKTILVEIFSPLARLPELSLGALPSREHALGFGTITASSWRCSGLLPGVSPYSVVQKTILGEIFSPLARLPELSLGALPPPRARSRVRYHQGILLAL